MGLLKSSTQYTNFKSSYNTLYKWSSRIFLNLGMTKILLMHKAGLSYFQELQLLGLFCYIRSVLLDFPKYTSLLLPISSPTFVPWSHTEIKHHFHMFTPSVFENGQWVTCASPPVSSCLCTFFNYSS